MHTYLGVQMYGAQRSVSHTLVDLLSVLLVKTDGGLSLSLVLIGSTRWTG